MTVVGLLDMEGTDLSGWERGAQGTQPWQLRAGWPHGAGLCSWDWADAGRGRGGSCLLCLWAGPC